MLFSTLLSKYEFVDGCHANMLITLAKAAAGRCRQGAYQQAVAADTAISLSERHKNASRPPPQDKIDMTLHWRRTSFDFSDTALFHQSHAKALEIVALIMNSISWKASMLHYFAETLHGHVAFISFVDIFSVAIYVNNAAEHIILSRGILFMHRCALIEAYVPDVSQSIIIRPEICFVRLVNIYRQHSFLL